MIDIESPSWHLNHEFKKLYIIYICLPNAGEEPSPLVEHLVKSVGRGDWDIDRSVLIFCFTEGSYILMGVDSLSRK